MSNYALRNRYRLMRIFQRADVQTGAEYFVDAPHREFDSSCSYGFAPDPEWIGRNLIEDPNIETVSKWTATPTDWQVINPDVILFPQLEFNFNHECKSLWMDGQHLYVNPPMKIEAGDYVEYSRNVTTDEERTLRLLDPDKKLKVAYYVPPGEGTFILDVPPRTRLYDRRWERLFDTDGNDMVAEDFFLDTRSRWMQIYAVIEHRGVRTIELWSRISRRKFQRININDVRSHIDMITTWPEPRA